MITSIRIVPKCMSIQINWENGTVWFYDLDESIEPYPHYHILKNEDIFATGVLNDTGTAIVWGDISIDAFTLYCWCVKQNTILEELTKQSKNHIKNLRQIIEEFEEIGGFKVLTEQDYKD